MEIQPMKLFSLLFGEMDLAAPRGRSQTWVRANWPVILTGVSLLALFVVVLAAIQFATPNLLDNDGYYHIKLARLMREKGPRPAFPWLPLTVLNPAHFVDHHFFYHVLLIPFTFGDLRVGAKWASVIFPAFAFLAGWLLLRAQRVPSAALWAIGFLVVSKAFLYRMCMPRAQSVSLLVLILALHVIFTGRYRWLLLLAFLYAWSYNAFPLILMVAGVYGAIRLLLDRHLDLAPLGYTAAGIGLGLVLNPYFPDNLVFIYHHLLPKVTETTGTTVGIEWYPYKTWTLVKFSGPALLAYVSGAFALGLRQQRMAPGTATLFIVATLFGLMLLKSRRFVEYFPAFTLLFCAAAWAPLIEEWRKVQTWRCRVLSAGLVILLGLGLWYTVPAVQASMHNSKPYQLFADASAWLQANTPPRSRVFQTDWDDFPRLFFYNTHNTYTAGLDPTYMQLYNEKLYDLWVDITRGRVENPAEAIALIFQSRYIITDLKHGNFLSRAKADPHLKEVYRDKYAAIFRVK